MSSTESATKLPEWTSLTGRTLEHGYELKEVVEAEPDRALLRVRVLGDYSLRALAIFYVLEQARAAEQANIWEGIRHFSRKTNLNVPLGAGTLPWGAQTVAYLVYQMPDETLSEVCGARALLPDEATEVLKTVARGLEDLHANGFVHGSVSPVEVLAIKDAIKVSLESIRAVNHEPIAERKKALYLAPESKTHNVTVAADVWCLGATVFEALTQKKYETGLFEEANELAHPFGLVTSCCLEADPAKRCKLTDVGRLLASKEPPPRPKKVTAEAAGAVIGETRASKAGAESASSGNERVRLVLPTSDGAEEAVLPGVAAAPAISDSGPGETPKAPLVRSQATGEEVGQRGGSGMQRLASEAANNETAIDSARLIDPAQAELAGAASAARLAETGRGEASKTNSSRTETAAREAERTASGRAAMKPEMVRPVVEPRFVRPEKAAPVKIPDEQPTTPGATPNWRNKEGEEDEDRRRGWIFGLAVFCVIVLAFLLIRSCSHRSRTATATRSATSAGSAATDTSSATAPPQADRATFPSKTVNPDEGSAPATTPRVGSRRRRGVRSHTPAIAKEQAATPNAALPASSQSAMGGSAEGSKTVWRVILYTYNRQEDADQKARELGNRRPDLEAEAYSPNEGAGPYLVVAGGKMKRDEAGKLRSKAVHEGMPRDSYVQNFSH